MKGATTKKDNSSDQPAANPEADHARAKQAAEMLESLLQQFDQAEATSGNRSGEPKELGALPARPEASKSLRQELQQEGSEQMDTRTTGEAEEAHKESSSPLTDLEVTSGSADATSGRPRRATRLPERYGEYCCYNTRLPANYVSDIVRIGRISANFVDRQELHWFEESKDGLPSISVGSLFAAVPDCIAN